MLREPSQFRVSLLPTHRRDYPSGSLALISCQDVDAGLPVSSYACCLQATLIHSMPWVSISHRMLWEPPCRTSQTLFIYQADRTHPSDEGVLCPSRRLHGPSRPDSVLWLAGAGGRYADSMNYPTAGNSGPPGQGFNHAASPSAGRAHPSQRGEPSLGLGWALPKPVAPKPRSSLRRSVGPTHACPTQVSPGN